MRIRTIKPEFWTHPVMAQLPPEAQLMAIALISWSDDHGYFEAEPRQVRGAVMPFRDDLQSVERDLSTLKGVDFIEVRSTDRGLIGRVVKFDSHQRVEKPKPSKLKAYFDTGRVPDESRTHPGRVADASREEGKGREVEGKGSGAPPESAALPFKLEVQSDPTPPKPKAPRETDALCADFEEVIGEKYHWQSEKDGTAFAALRKTTTLEEIRARWRSGLKSNDKWLSVRTVAQLRSKWNDLAKMPLDLTGDWRSRVDHSKDFFGEEPHAQ